MPFDAVLHRDRLRADRQRLLELWGDLIRRIGQNGRMAAWFPH